MTKKSKDKKNRAFSLHINKIYYHYLKEETDLRAKEESIMDSDHNHLRSGKRKRSFPPWIINKNLYKLNKI